MEDSLPHILIITSLLFSTKFFTNQLMNFNSKTLNLYDMKRSSINTDTHDCHVTDIYVFQELF